MLTQSRLKKLLHYDKDTGIFTRKTSMGPYSPGTIAGKVGNRGYVRFMVDGKKYLAHRVTFLYMEGYFPEYQIDHINGIKKDNRWKNLRHVSQICNLQNQSTSKNNKSGFNGVYWREDKNGWAAQGMVDRKKTFLGHHVSKLEAALARLTWEINCDRWKCNRRGELVKAIKKEWPEFKLRCA